MKMWRKVLLLFPIIILIAVYAVCFVDSDIYYLLPNGNYILQTGKFPTINPFCTWETKMVMQNAWYAILLAFIYNRMGEIGLVILQALFLICLVLWMNFFLRKHPLYYRTGILILLFLSFGYLNLRPEILTFLLVSGECIALSIAEEKKRYEYLFLIPVLFFTEANFHASYLIVHILVMGPFMIKAWIKKDRKLSVFLPIIMGIGILGSFLNPYGKDNVFYAYDALKNGTFTGIDELKGIHLCSMTGLITVISCLLWFYLIYQRKISIETFLLYGGFLYLTVYQTKWVTFLCLGSLYLCKDMDIIHVKRENIYETMLGRLFLGVGVLFPCMTIICFPEDIILYRDTIQSVIQNERLIEGKLYGNDIQKMEEEIEDGASVFSLFQTQNYFEFMGHPVFYDARPELYQRQMNTQTAVFQGLDEQGNKNTDLIRLDSLLATDCEYFYVRKKKVDDVYYRILQENPTCFLKIKETKNSVLYRKIS